MIETGRLAHDGDECWDTEPWHVDAWRRGRDVLDAYDDDRVLSEELADDLVNELAGRALGSRRRADADRPWRPGMLAGSGVEGRGRRRRRPHLSLVPGGREG
ncbi:hypothetical protein [Actinomycetospora sp. TBRC 11914]|uniref:hypothetical protein n=1 Tax=Actinomycetospora sp. TBRC 11914 TaxID=2729387 RepID=UPI00145DFD02|nr:hypothetical protein [Actinomycetospora sp. TBRC 11914]NMO89244.1 hypothetical protein [Actinomycetospora sp. TBRC 11914]